MSEVMLNDIFQLSPTDIENGKISLNISSGKNAPLCLDKWLQNGSTEDGFWAYYGSQCNFKIGTLCLAFYKLDWTGNQYLFVGAGRITNIPNKEALLPAEYESISCLEKYIGRLIIDVYKGNTMGRFNFNLKKYINQCKVVSILPQKYNLERFPGYSNLKLSYEELYRGIYLDDSWKTALQLQKGVYAIVDTAPNDIYSGLGRIYIGSATSDRGMLFSRWKNYVDTLDGGNTELKTVKKKKGEEYIKKYFQWSLIEHFNETTDDEYILEREKYWKLVFNTVAEGLNDNY